MSAILAAVIHFPLPNTELDDLASQSTVCKTANSISVELLIPLFGIYVLEGPEKTIYMNKLHNIVLAMMKTTVKLQIEDRVLKGVLFSKHAQASCLRLHVISTCVNACTYNTQMQKWVYIAP